MFRRGLDTASAEDVVQEVALRALANGVTYASAQDLLRWAGPVACNLHVDLLRHRARLTDGEVGTEHPALADVAGEVADRMELQRALRGIAALRPADRAAIIDAVTEEATPRSRKEAVKLAVRRHRARSRLLVVLEQLAGTVGALAGLRWLRRGRRAAVALAVVPAAAIVLPLVGTFVVQPGHHGGTRPPVAASWAGLQQPVWVDRADRMPSSPSARLAAPVRTAPKAAKSGATSSQPLPPVNRVNKLPDAPKPGVSDRDRTEKDTHWVCVKNAPLSLGEVCV